MMSVAWANNLKSKKDIKAGQVLRIPPVTGLIVTVSPTDTLDGSQRSTPSIARTSWPRTASTTPNLVVGQVLVVRMSVLLSTCIWLQAHPACRSA